MTTERERSADAPSDVAEPAGAEATGDEGIVEMGLAERAGAETRDDEGFVEMVLAEHAAREALEAPRRIDGVVVGLLAGLDEAGEPLVDFPENPDGAPRPARATAALGPDDLGREVALLFERGDARRPIVMGLLHRRAAPREAAAPASSLGPLSLESDGERVVLSAEKEIVLRCGKASITLTRAGKILIRGAYVLSRSSGVQRIVGGSVQIN